MNTDVQEMSSITIHNSETKEYYKMFVSMLFPSVCSCSQPPAQHNHKHNYAYYSSSLHPNKHNSTANNTEAHFI